MVRNDVEFKYKSTQIITCHVDMSGLSCRHATSRDAGRVTGSADDGAAHTLADASLAAIARRGVPVPGYDRSRLIPRIVHIGVGGFHRAHLALYTDELARNGGDWGIRGLGMLANDAAMRDALTPQDGLYTLIEREDDRSTPRVIGSLVDYALTAGHPDATVEILAGPQVAIVSMTITEAGYGATERDDTAFHLIAAALERRRDAGRPPLTILSCDNLPGNGDAARAATLAAARRRNSELAGWIETACTFPNSMVDRITPATTDDDRAWLAREHGIVDRWPVVAEPFRQWIIEDRFVNGRPGWEAAGAVFTDDVESWELYKLRLLNAAHSSMAYLCALDGITFVDEAMATPAVLGFLETLLRHEAIPSLHRIPGSPPEDYVTTVLRRFANTGVRDQIARLCVDGASKFPTFLVPTIEHQLATDGPIACGALALAGWARYLGTVDEAEQAPDAAAGSARELAVAARTEPARFLELDGVMSPSLRGSSRFRSAFEDAYRAVAEHGPLHAMAALGPRDRGTHNTV
jgi:mannitol 2-dehydrogenase